MRASATGNHGQYLTSDGALPSPSPLPKSQCWFRGADAALKKNPDRPKARLCHRRCSIHRAVCIRLARCTVPRKDICRGDWGLQCAKCILLASGLLVSISPPQWPCNSAGLSCRLLPPFSPPNATTPCAELACEIAKECARYALPMAVFPYITTSSPSYASNPLEPSALCRTSERA